ncbi:PAS domain S-box protein [Ruminococcus sp. OA3]|uniref:PAS domain-containing hybrid sensor histidine kinase/response regulator n=1 Tax=Ruminococcus sp. OA3 TaxID=2914164 RepID=UPI001F06C668|nr:PAS domain S-box protein [Ruminococcus sp. OA3]MCH1984115.1 PAS domain S-box protein [Ruminococcus sp. OA3]
MTEENQLSMDQMTVVLDNAPVAVYVTSIENRKLLYVNRMARDLFVGRDADIRGLTCYRAAGFDSPCSFCRMGEMSRSELWTREFWHPGDERLYQLSGKIIDWAGTPAHIEYILDITEKKKEEELANEQEHLRKELTGIHDKMQDIINAIPGGVAIYKVSDVFETIYFSDGVPELSGYTVEEYRELIKQDAALMIYRRDMDMVLSKARKVIQCHGMGAFEFRKQHRDGHIVWVHVHVKWIGEEDGCQLLHCVFHNITELKQAKLELEYLVNSIPGGIASYRVEGTRFVPVFFSDGAMALSGHTREEYGRICKHDIFDAVYEPDRERVRASAYAAFASGDVLDISYRMQHKDGNLIWIHLNGRRMGNISEDARFYAVFTGMSGEARLFQSMADEMTDGIYVIDKATYDLLYANESRNSIMRGTNYLGKKCYELLFHKNAPCEFCTLRKDGTEGEEHDMQVGDTDRVYSTRFRELDWNGIPAYVKYIRDITEEVQTRKEKELLEIYFRNVVEKLPGGVSVICCEKDGTMRLEFVSDGLAAMTHMTVEEVKDLYAGDLFAGVHPDDRKENLEILRRYMERGEGHCELTGRMKRGDGGYIWTRLTLSLIRMTDGARRLYCMYTDISKNIEEKEQLRRQYEEIILQHYRTPGPDALIVGHCNVSQNRILDIIDYTHSGLLQTFGHKREEFFSGIAGFVQDEEERKAFMRTYLNEPVRKAFEKGDMEHLIKCFVRLPGDQKGRYVQFKVNLLEAPDTGDITGILTVTDITEQIVSDRILHQLSETSHDVVMDLNLDRDYFTLLSCNPKAGSVPVKCGRLSERVKSMLQSSVVPKDREEYARELDIKEMRRRLEKEGSYTFSYSILDENHDIRTKNITVSAIDMRLGRACLMCTDITASVREQQGLLNMLAYTFELMGFINIRDEQFTLFTRQAVLENLSPYIIDHYNESVTQFVNRFVLEESKAEAFDNFLLETMLQRLEKEPAGYDFVIPYREDTEILYKQVNVLWGDQNHRTVCMVRADVTDMLTAERQSKEALEKALILAKEANLAKSDFLSAMSHDIRTPMNAIMGMTTLAQAHLKNTDRVADCLQKIAVASRHLLSLVNDVLDMSRIERSKITLNCRIVSLGELIQQISAIMDPQAREAGLHLERRMEKISQEHFWGDSLRISQILINILSNAVKFTPEGGRIDFLVEQIPAVQPAGHVRYRFTVQDTGIGMPEEYLVNIFIPFSRDYSARRIEGTGLGLSITRGLVDLMGGSIAVESQVNEGTTFKVELEYEIALIADETREKVLGGTDGDRTEEWFAGRRFLVAEDNDINAEILCELLLLHGAETVLVDDGQQAVNEFENTEPGTYDAILMDIQMPGMNGYEATRAIRKMGRRDAGNIPVIAMTANAFTEDIQESARAGMTAHVSKPIDMDILRATLESVLDE